MKKRIISILLLILMLLGVFASCDTVVTTPTPTDSAKPTTSATPTPSATPTTTLTSDTTAVKTSSELGDMIVPEHLKNLDFNGEKIGIILSGNDEAYRSIIPTDNLSNSVNVAFNIRNSVVETLLNVEIEPKGVIPMQSMMSHLRTYFASPDTSYDIVGIYQFFDLGIAYGEEDHEFFYDYGKIEDDKMFIDIESEYWDKKSYDTLSYDGKHFWITGDFSQTWIETMFVSYVNADIWAEYEDEIAEITGVDGDIYDLVYEGKWTIDLWLQLNELVHINKDENESAVTPEDQHGFVGYSSESNINNIIVDGMFSGCHVTFSEIKNGTPSMDYNNDALKAYSRQTQALYNNSKSCLFPYNGDMTAMDVFEKGNSLMTVNTLMEAEYIAKGNYYILPPPKANEDQGDYATSTGDSTNHFGIPRKCENLAAVTATLEALGYYSYQIVTPVYYDVVLKGAIQKGDVDALEMMSFIRSKIYYDFALMHTGYYSENFVWYLRKNIGNPVLANEAMTKEIMWGKQLKFTYEEIGITDF